MAYEYTKESFESARKKTLARRKKVAAVEFPHSEYGLWCQCHICKWATSVYGYIRSCENCPVFTIYDCACMNIGAYRAVVDGGFYEKTRLVRIPNEQLKEYAAEIVELIEGLEGYDPIRDCEVEE